MFPIGAWRTRIFGGVMLLLFALRVGSQDHPRPGETASPVDSTQGAYIKVTFDQIDLSVKQIDREIVKREGEIVRLRDRRSFLLLLKEDTSLVIYPYKKRARAEK